MSIVKLSIIVPIYGVEQYLHKCVESLLSQDISNYEIILVDDGSPDECPAICDQFAAEYDNIRVIHRENGGLSAARNSGIEVAKGEYIMFVDSDDYLEPNVLGTLIKTMEEKQLDVLRYNYQNVNEHYEVFLPYKDAKRDVDYSETVTDGETFLNERLGPMCYAWAFVIKRELLKGSLFKEGIYFEDVEWTPRMLLRAKRVSSISIIVYNYLWRVGSISLAVSPEKIRKTVEDKIGLLCGFKELRKLVKNPRWFDWMTSFTTMTILDILSGLPANNRNPYIENLKSLQIFPLMTKKEKILSHKVKIMLANISPSLYCTLMSLRK